MKNILYNISMKKVLLLLFLILIYAFPALAETEVSRPGNVSIDPGRDMARITWDNPEDISFSHVVLFRSSIPIEEHFTYEAVENLCDTIYEGAGKSFTDTGLAENLPYYYILFAFDLSGNSSAAMVREKLPAAKEPSPKQARANTLAGVPSEVVNEVSFNEAGIVYSYNQPVNYEDNSESRRLSLFIIARSPHSLSDSDKNSISYFIHEGTATTIFLGSGERAGVLNSYLSVFDKLPRSTLEWQDVIKIANGRWPNERNLEKEDEAADTFFSKIYVRQPNMDDPNDSAAVTVIAYGLRPAVRNLDSEKKAIEIYRSIFNKDPVDAVEWDIVRAIAYSGAVR